MWVTGDLTLDQFGTLVNHEGYPKLADYLHAKFPGTKFITVGEKSYAVESATAPSRRHRRASVQPPVRHVRGHRLRQPRRPVAVPVRQERAGGTSTQPKCGRFYINSDSSNDYTTATTPPAWMYPEDGNRFFPGHDKAHLGGDTWAADAAMKMMEREDWSGMFVTLGAIDKAGHMWGAYHDRQSPPGSR